MSSIIFVNGSKTLPIIVSSWIDVMSGLSTFQNVHVLPGEQVILKSSVGEWIVGSLFPNKEDYHLWKDAKLPFDCNLAKFRDKPCRGVYTWNESDKYSLIYDDGKVTWNVIE
jgi:hypothetical protein